MVERLTGLWRGAAERRAERLRRMSQRGLEGEYGRRVEKARWRASAMLMLGLGGWLHASWLLFSTLASGASGSLHVAIPLFVGMSGIMFSLIEDCELLCQGGDRRGMERLHWAGVGEAARELARRERVAASDAGDFDEDGKGLS